MANLTNIIKQYLSFKNINLVPLGKGKDKKKYYWNVSFVGKIKGSGNHF